MSISSIFQFILGFIIGVSILAGGSAGVGYLLFTKMASNPSKPIFPEEQPKPKETPQKESKTESTTGETEAKPKVL